MSEMPDFRGHFGEYGGRFVPETLMPALEELEAAWRSAREEHAFKVELDELLRRYAGRPTPLSEARRMSADLGGRRVLLKREDLCHTGAHKINNTSARSSSLAGCARAGSSLKRGPDNTGSPPQPPVRSSACLARF